jgi:galactitol-specific phosphotransferase system IIB component
MKKVIFAIAVSVLFLSACGTGTSTSTEANPTDSIKVYVDSVGVDTTVAQCCADSSKK